jgi:hypothetical protein
MQNEARPGALTTDGDLPNWLCLPVFGGTRRVRPPDAGNETEAVALVDAYLERATLV